MTNPKILLVIDVQNCFINERTAAIPYHIKKYITEHHDEYSSIIFSRFVNDGNANFSRIGFDGCREDDDGSNIVDEIAQLVSNYQIVEKNTYSVFKHRAIQKTIAKDQIREVHLCGLTSDGCVLASAFDGFDMGLKVKVLKDLTGTCWGDEEFNRSILKLIGYKIDPKLLEEE